MAIDFGLWELLYLATGILQAGLGVAGVVICYRFRRLSSRLTILLVAFVLELVSWGMTWANWLLPRHMFDFLPFPVTIVINLVSGTLIVVGLALLLADVRNQLTDAAAGHATRASVPTRPRVPNPDDLGHWRGRTPGSRDIQE